MGESKASKYLRYIAEKGFQRRKREGGFLEGRDEEYRERFQYELEMIIELGYADYFLVIWDIVREAKNRGILCGPARGSVAGSLVAYVVGITEVDPIRFDLIFERFMNPVRSKMDPPDVDMDFQASRRDEVKQYIIEKYGEDRVVSIGSMSVMYASTALKDVFRAYELDVSELNSIIANKLYKMELDEALEKLPKLREYIESDARRKEAFEVACRLQKLARHRTVHPAGLIIAPGGEISDYIPVVKAKGTIVSQWKDSHVAKVGMLKVDVLGLSTLDVIDSTVKLIEKRKNKRILLGKIPLDDEEVLRLFDRGDTGTVFQFETHLLRDLCVKMGVREFEDLVAITTIARPASLETGVTERFIRRRNGEEEVTYLHPSLKEVLSSTYGLPIFQEQFMRMAHVVGEIPIEDTEIMRDAIKHFKRDVMARYEKRFKEGAIRNGASEETAQEMWDEILSASGYSYNRAHAVSYSLISYWCAWFKVHYPLEWYASCLTFENDPKKVRQVASEAISKGCRILPVELNLSEKGFTIYKGSILAGLTSVKGLGEKAAEEIIEKRPYNPRRLPDSLIEKVERRAVNSRVIEALRKAGAFGESTPSDLIQAYGFLPASHLKLDYKRIKKCEMCELCQTRTKVVVGSGKKGGVMFVGEAPGEKEDLSGVPFVGYAGKVFRKLYLEGLGLERREVYVTNAVKCRPVGEDGRNKKPSQEQVLICSMWLEKEIRLVKPKLIVLLGSTALNALTEERSILEAHGKVVYLRFPSGEPIEATGFAMVHPAFLIRNKEFDIGPALEDLKELLKWISTK